MGQERMEKNLIFVLYLSLLSLPTRSMQLNQNSAKESRYRLESYCMDTASCYIYAYSTNPLILTLLLILAMLIASLRTSHFPPVRTFLLCSIFSETAYSSIVIFTKCERESISVEARQNINLKQTENTCLICQRVCLRTFPSHSIHLAYGITQNSIYLNDMTTENVQKKEKEILNLD